MKTLRPLVATIALSAVACGAAAQTSANAQRCQTLGAEVQAEFQKALQARVPKTDPGTFVQEGYDIKSIMSQDVSSGLGKLLSIDFGSIINSVVNKGLQQAGQKAATNFSNKMNGILSSVGVNNVSFQLTSLKGVNVNGVAVGDAVKGAASEAISNAAGGAVNNATSSLYGR